MNIKAVALNHMVEDRTGFFRPKSIQFNCVPNHLGAHRDRGHCRPCACARIENVYSVPASTERQETPNSLCFLLWQGVVPEFLPRNSAHGETSFRCLVVCVCCGQLLLP